MYRAAPSSYDLTRKRVWVAGHRGLVGSAIMRELRKFDCELLTVERSQLDLRRKSKVDKWMRAYRPQTIFLAAATVGGIAANIAQPGDFIYDNLAIAGNVLESARQHKVEKLMFLGSSCVYPRLAAQPMREDDMMAGPLEPTSEPYAIAKLAGIAMCSAYRKQYGLDFISVIPTNLFGPGDNLDASRNHVIPAMIAKVREAKMSGNSVDVWGSGKPRREFLFVDDAANAMVFLMRHYSSRCVINIGCGENMSIGELALAVAECIGFKGDFAYDTSRPDGMPFKALDSSRLLSLGWRPRTKFLDGLAATCKWISQKRFE